MSEKPLAKKPKIEAADVLQRVALAQERAARAQEKAAEVQEKVLRRF